MMERDTAIRPLILFDLNGVLICESKRDDKLRRVAMSIRPQFERILELLPHYNVGIFSSATSRTVQRALGAISSYLKDTRVVPPQMLDILPGRQVWRLFSLVMDRSNCIPDLHWRSRPDGRDYDTLKPLLGNGLNPLQTLLVDNHARKAAPGEDSNILILPTWEHCRDSGVATWNCLIDYLLVACKDGPAPRDMRPVVKMIVDEVMAIHIAMSPPEQIDLDQDNDENEREPEEDEEEELKRGSKLTKAALDDDIASGREMFPSSSSMGLGVGSLAGDARDRLPGAQPLYSSHQQPSSSDRERRGQGGFSQLHTEVEKFASRARPTRSETEVVARTLRSIKDAVCSLWPHATTCLFGSQASGLALPGSDLDVVILGVVEDLATPGAGFGKRGKSNAVDHLKKLANLLRKHRLVKGLKVIQARVPIIKAVFPTPDGTSIPADISIGVANGAAAVSMVRHAVMLLPPLRPLVLVLKALLRETKLNEVFSGGLSSYSLVNMVIAHLQCEGFQAHGVAEAGRAPATSAIVNSMGMMEEQGDFAQFINHGVEQSHDLGHLLTTFLHRFGSLFDYSNEAVSIASGGIVKKPPGWKRDNRNEGRGSLLLGVEDPQQAFRDIGSGSHNVKAVRRIFSEALSALDDGIQAASTFSSSAPQASALNSQGATTVDPSVVRSVNILTDGGSPGMTERERWREIQQDGQNVSMDQLKPSSRAPASNVNNVVDRAGPLVLDYVFDVNLSLARDPASVRLRSTSVARLAQRKAWLKSTGKLPPNDDRDDDDDGGDRLLEGRQVMNRKERKKRRREEEEERSFDDEARSLNVEVKGLNKIERKRVMKAARKALKQQQKLAPLHFQGVQKQRKGQESSPKKKKQAREDWNGSMHPQLQESHQAKSAYLQNVGKMGRHESRAQGAALGLSKRQMKRARKQAEAQRKAQEVHMNPAKVAAEIERLRSQLHQAQQALRQTQGASGMRTRSKKKMKLKPAAAAGGAPQNEAKKKSKSERQKRRQRGSKRSDVPIYTD